MAEKLIITPASVDDLPHMVDFQLNMAFETEGLKLDKRVLRMGLDLHLMIPAKQDTLLQRVMTNRLGC